ncbi:alpha/beta-hydrolase [Auriculariales sp. MPI-PUGE-AT-0066]|nr:alpha/beta-hydrolase [Auriculariales sp. MPI-PUGE-AT-0066]
MLIAIAARKLCTAEAIMIVMNVATGQVYIWPVSGLLEVLAPRLVHGRSTGCSAQVNAFDPFTFLAAASYCQPAATLSWNCAPCGGVPDVVTTASGGDGASVQFWFVGFSTSLNSVVVGHQAVITDADIIRENLDPTLFPGVPSNVKAHGGFLDGHARAAPDVFAAVNTTLLSNGVNQITIASHSLGAALGLLDAVMFRQRLPGVNIKFVGYGMPRVGNKEFANFVDANLPDVTRVVNQQDPVPILPGRFLGFRHPSGEVHIGEKGQFLACNGQESEEDGCTIDSTRFIFQAEKDDHSGPYHKLKIGCGLRPT